MTKYKIKDADGDLINSTFETTAAPPFTLVEREDMHDCYRVKDSSGADALHSVGGVIEITIMAPGPFTVEAT